MRVSTSQIFDSGLQGMLRNQSALLNTQNHISAKKRVLTPSDDPVAAARALVPPGLPPQAPQSRADW